MPADEPRAFVDGIDSLRVLLIGDGPALGFGVTSHDLALPGHLARQLAAATGRGAIVDLIAGPKVSIENVEELFAAQAPEKLDAIVVFLGNSDSIRVTKIAVWRDKLDSFLRHLSEQPHAVPVLVLGIPPLARIPMLRGVPTILANRHALLLDRELRSAADEHPAVTYLPFEPPAEPDKRRYRSSNTYREWASLVSPELTRLVMTGAQSIDKES